MAGNGTHRLGAAAKRAARGALGAVAPALLRRVQLARAQRRYASPPRLGPRRVLLEATTACNYRCLMCTDHGSLRTESTPAKLMPWERIEGLLRELAAMGAEQVWLAGRGEPLTHPQASETIALASSLGMRTMVTTNAGLLTDALADELCDAGLATLSISINSGCPQTYADVHGARPEERARILSLMKRLSQRPRHPWISTSMVLLKPNFEELPDFVSEAIEAGVKAVDVLGLRCAGLFPTLELSDGEWERARRAIAATGEQAARSGVHLTAYCIPPDPAQASAERPAVDTDRSHWTLGCFVGYRFVRIDVDGIVHGCCACGNRLGSLEGASLAEVWHSPSYERFRMVCRAMGTTKQAPYRCDCADCGNTMDNEEVYRELHFRPVPAAATGAFATRLELARVVWDHLGDLLPHGEEAEGYGDLGPEQAGDSWAAVAGLQAAGVMVGQTTTGRPLFLPRRFATYADAARVLQRAASVLGTSAPEAEQLVTSAAPALRAPDPLLRSEVEQWVRAVRSKVARAVPAG
jgi:MoaA/NifB/PqqE/SkfB family radical SAM enzyme